MGVELMQRYELAAKLCEGRRVLAIDSAFEPGRRLLEERVAALSELPGTNVDAVVALDGLVDPGRREEVLEEAERRLSSGASVLLAFAKDGGPGTSPRVGGALDVPLARLPGAVSLHQYLAEGSVIRADGARVVEATLDDSTGAGPEDAEALIVAAGFDDAHLGDAVAHMRMSVSPVLREYVRRLEAANAELLRANRALMREHIGSAGSAAASIADVRARAEAAERKAEEMEEIARQHEAMVHRVRAWYDAPRYHLVDRVRDVLRRIPFFRPAVRFAWNLISTKPEDPRLAAVHEKVERNAAVPEQPGEGEHERLEG